MTEKLRDQPPASSIAEVEFGYEVLEGVGRTGVVGILRNGVGQTVLARADMDALPVRENTGLPYASTHTAVDDEGNTVGVSHACGHDAHVTCLLGEAELLARTQQAWGGTFIALFQPAEEVAGAALSFGIRLIAIWRGWHLPVPGLPQRPKEGAYVSDEQEDEVGRL